MCGILGIVADRPVDRHLARRMRETMCHRGPDGYGEVWLRGDTIALLHRRLAIIDLHERASQPMSSDDGLKYIVFNGEIYNFRDLRKELVRRGFSFHTESDTEVILKAYEAFGLGFIERLNGMFAFAVVDLEKNRLLLARDRVGEKPLFYYQDAHRVSFASELKALLTDPNAPRELHGEALDCFLSFGYVPGWRSILKGYRKLPPGHFLNMDLQTGAVSVARYWRPPDPPPDGQDIDEQGLCEELRGLLSDAVRRQLIADVPVGVLLSGGVDSSLVAALAAQHTPRVRTFTIRFPGSELDESRHAHLIARHIGSDHVVLDAGGQSVELLPELAEQYDEPMADSSAIPTFLVSKLTRRYCTVALGGDGGDELFGGYTSYSRLLQLNRGIGWIPRPLRRLVAQLARAGWPRYWRGRGLLRQFDADLRHALPDNCFLFDRNARRILLAALGPGGSFGAAEEIWMEGVDSRLPLLARSMRRDYDYYLPDDVLVKVDRASMRNSLEVRSPLLDYRVVEFAFGKVPIYKKVNDRGRKLFLKRAACTLLPDGFDYERKQGFRAPLQDWFNQSSARGFLIDSLSGFAAAFGVNLPVVLGAQGSSGWEQRVYALAMFELWRRRYRITS